VPPPVAFNVLLSPTHIVDGIAVAAATGGAMSCPITTDALVLHIAPSVIITP